MGQKVNPNIFRIAPSLFRRPYSEFYANKYEYSLCIKEDIDIRSVIYKTCQHALLSEIKLSRTTDTLIATIVVKKVGLVVGKDGSLIEKLKLKLAKCTKLKCSVNVKEVKNSFVDADQIAHQIAYDIKKRNSIKKSMNMAVENAMKHGALGIKIKCSGRIGGAEIARNECIKKGKLSLHTLNSNIFYTMKHVNTLQGVMGLKIWIAKNKFNLRRYS